MNNLFVTKILFTILISMIGTNAFAADIAVENADGVIIYYNYINDAQELEVTHSSNFSPYLSNYDYSSNLVIPEEVTFMERTRKVTSIGKDAFHNCSGLTSVTIPNSVTSIGQQAFENCRGLSSVTIGNSVTYIGKGAFDDCSSLTSVTIPNSVTYIGEGAFHGCSGLTSVTIGNSVTYIDKGAFGHCSGLISVTIPNSVTYIGENAFAGCSGLISVNIPNSVTSIGQEAFGGCICLISVIIPNSVTSISNYTFSGCRGLTSVTIPNSVTSVGNYAFENCSGLTSITIPNSVSSIGEGAFYGADISTVISLIENPYKINGKSSWRGAFSTNTFNNATLYVPVGTIDKYKTTGGWKDFLFIEEGTGPDGGGETPETNTCAKPTIGYQNGKLTFRCETEGATCQYTITDDDINSGSANEIQLGVTYRINVYATKDGYNNSETATATLCWIDVEPKTEGITNGVANVRALPLLIQSSGSTLTVSGADDGTHITIYSINGTEAGSAISQNGAATIPTTLQSGSAAIVKVGNKSIKVVVK